MALNCLSSVVFDANRCCWLTVRCCRGAASRSIPCSLPLHLDLNRLDSCLVRVRVRVRGRGAARRTPLLSNRRFYGGMFTPYTDVRTHFHHSQKSLSIHIALILICTSMERPYFHKRVQLKETLWLWPCMPSALHHSSIV